MKIPSTRPRAPCVFRFNSTEMASPARTLQSQRSLWSFAKLDIFPVSSIFSILLSNPRVATKTGLARWIRTCFACPSTGIKGTRETQRRIQEDAGRRDGFQHGQQRNHDFHRVSNSAHGRAHARSFSSVALRRPLNLYRKRDDRKRASGWRRFSRWNLETRLCCGAKLEIWNWNENWCSERDFILYLLMDKIRELIKNIYRGENS